MPTELEKRAALLAISRYGVDAARIRSACQQADNAREQGRSVDLVDSFVHANLLTTAQANDLRETLDKTQLDLGAKARSPVPGSQGVGAAVAVPEVRAATEPLEAIGDYRLLRRLGEGGMGEVYLAYHEAANRQVALKVLSPLLEANAALVERFEREAKHSVKLDHPNIVRGLGVGKDEKTGRHYLVMEYVDGPSAQALLDKYARLSIGDALHITLDIAHALEHAHSRSIIHRDIKPENILITKSGLAKLADLGLAKQIDQASHLTATRQGFGTPYYVPYEQAINAKLADGRSDIYALGATLYHLLTGQVPFKGDNQLEILEKKELGSYPPASLYDPKIPDALDQILHKMLARDPQDRYQTASELIIDLERSKLAAPVLSFVDRVAVMQDPLARASALAPVQATHPDLSTVPYGAEKDEPDTWYVRYHDGAGKLCRVRATTQHVLQRIREGRLNGTAQASRSRDGEYLPLGDQPEFRLAVREHLTGVGAPPEETVPSEQPEEEAGLSERGQWILIGVMMAILVMIGLALLLLL